MTHSYIKHIHPIAMIELYLARHGETAENVAQILQGHLPGQLTENGRRQAVELRQRLKAEDCTFDLLLVSDLQRTIDTAHIVNEALKLPLVHCPLLRERNWGSLTGMPVITARQTALPADVESVEAMFERAHRFLDYVASTYPGKRVLAIGHGLFSRCIQAALAGCEIRDIPRMQNAEVRKVLIGRLLHENNEVHTDTVSVD